MSIILGRKMKVFIQPDTITHPLKSRDLVLHPINHSYVTCLEIPHLHAAYPVKRNSIYYLFPLYHMAKSKTRTNFSVQLGMNAIIE